MTPSLRFPLQAGGTKTLRFPSRSGATFACARFPSRSGGNLKEGGNYEPERAVGNTNRQAKVHKKQQLMTPTIRFPQQAWGTQQARVSDPRAKWEEPNPYTIPLAKRGDLRLRAVPLAKRGEPKGLKG